MSAFFNFGARLRRMNHIQGGDQAEVRATTLIRPSGTFSRGEKVRTPPYGVRADPQRNDAEPWPSA